jgi:hypothetical protein
MNIFIFKLTLLFLVMLIPNISNKIKILLMVIINLIDCTFINTIKNFKFIPCINYEDTYLDRILDIIVNLIIIELSNMNIIFILLLGFKLIGLTKYLYFKDSKYLINYPDLITETVFYNSIFNNYNPLALLSLYILKRFSLEYYFGLVNDHIKNDK